MNGKNKKQTQSGGGFQFGRRLGPPTEKARDVRGAVRKLFAYLGAEKAIIYVTVILAASSTGLGTLAPYILGQATDEIFAGLIRMVRGESGIDFSRVGEIMLIMIGLHAASIFLNYIQGYIMAGVSMRITYRLRAQLSEKIHRLPLKYFDKNQHGDVLSRITNDADTLSNALNTGLTSAIMSAVQVIGIIIMMLTINPILTLVAMTILPLSGVCMGVIVKKSQKYFKAQQDNLGKLNGHVEEMFTSHAIVKSFNGENASAEAFDIHNEELYRAGWKANFAQGMMMPIVGFISNLGYVAIVVIGGAFAVGGRMTIGGIQAFIQYTRQFGHPVAQLTTVVSMFQQAAAASERVFEFLAEEEEVEDFAGASPRAAWASSPASAERPAPHPHELFEKSSTKTLTGEPRECAVLGESFEGVSGETFSKVSPEVLPFQGRISFENVNFGYDPDTPVIKNFTAEIKPGQKIAIVGHTGAGKTTIVKLLMRFYDVNSGKISVDGKDIRKYTRDGLRSHFGMVLQDTWLFNGTIAENIRYGKLDATDIEMKNAAQAAQAHHFIRTFPDSYNMRINEEADNISAGQKQLLTIARTILADPDILILDEATSNVDTRTEVQIQRAMDNLMKGRTCFVIAHRLSTIRSADIVLVMHEGDIVEQGTHENLLDKNGVYSRLYNSQFDVVE